MNVVNASRRHFLKSTGIAGSGLVLGFSLSGCSSGQPPVKPIQGALTPNAFLQLTEDNNVRFYCPRDEMGQGVTTGLATLIAEELDVAPSRIEIAFAGPHPAYNNPIFGVQGTGGSTSIKAHYQQLRQAGANARALLLAAAAAETGVPVSELSTNDGHILVHGAGRPYGDFVAKASALQVPEEAPLKANGDFKYIGKDFPRLDAVAKSTGTALYGIDVDIPNMHYAVVKRSPVVGGVAQSVQRAPVLNMPGVTDLVEIGSGVAVVAKSFWQAKKAADALQIEWSVPQFASVNSAQIKADYRQALLDEEGVDEARRGDLTQAFGLVRSVIDNEYWTPYLAHAPLEPMNAVVRIENGEADVWSGTQGIAAAQGLVARYAGLDKEKVRAHGAYLGGAFGRRATLTHVIEATQTAVATNKPIHLTWTREDDIKHGVYRPASLMRIKAGIDADGHMIAWQAKRVGGNIMPDTLRNMMPALLPSAVPDGMVEWVVGLANSAFDGWVVDHSSIEGLYEDYDFPNREVRHVTVNHGLPLTFWRSVGHSFTAFAKETAVDELAEKANLDVVDFRLRNLRAKPRLAQVVKVAGERMARMRPANGRHLGFAAHSSFNTDVAEVAEVSVADGRIKVHKVLCVVDCGQAINPDIVRAQMEGAVMFGLTAALHGNLEIEHGEIKESNFHDYPILRMDEAPDVEVVIIESDQAPTGVGEPGLPPIAPAVANAVYAATGQRLRSLPLKLA